MSTKFCFLFFLCFIPFLNVSAQYTELINANRPGASQSAFSVGTDVIQIETGFSYGKEKHALLYTETNGLAMDYSIRYGIWKEQLEFSIMGEFQSNSITDNSFTPPLDQKASNFKSNTIGAKYLIYDPYKKRDLQEPNLYSWNANNRFQWEDLIPAVSFYAGANIDFADNPFTPEDDSSLSPKFVISTQNNWIGGWVFVTNIVVDRITTDFPTYGYILTLTHATNRYFSVFLENQGMKSDFYADQILRGGAAALVSPNFQLDFSISVNFKDTPSKYYGRLGLAYRFDLHKTDELIEDENTDEKDKEKKEKKEKKDKKKNREQELESDSDLDNER